MKKELKKDIKNKHVELKGMLNRREINTIGRHVHFKYVTLRQYKVEHAERIDSVQEKIPVLKQKAAKFSYSRKSNVAKKFDFQVRDGYLKLEKKALRIHSKFTASI